MAAGPLLAVAFLVAALAGIGFLLPWPRRTGQQSRAFGLILAASAGMVGFFLVLLLAAGLGIRWSPISLLILLVVVGIGVEALRRRWATGVVEARPPGSSTWRWGEATALFVLLVFAGLALTQWITTPDFVYHWGLKGERFFADGRIDFDDLHERWNEPIHPDYPNLLPTLYAASALLVGHFDAGALMLWSVFFFGLLLIATREALRAEGSPPAVTQAALALVALVLGAFAIGYLQAGGADWLVALAVVAAIPALTAPLSPELDRQVAVLAALSAAAKVEGVALAGILLAVHGLRGPRRLLEGRRAVEFFGPTLAVLIPWQGAVRHYHLFQAFNAGRLDLSRWPRVMDGLSTTLGVSAWHGFAWALLLVPLLFWQRRLRPLGVVLALQASFYVYVFLSVRIEPVPLILASFPRLVFQVLPATLVGLVLLGTGHRATPPVGTAVRPEPAV